MPALRKSTRASLQYGLRPRKARSLAEPSSSSSEHEQEDAVSVSDPDVAPSKSSEDEDDQEVQSMRPSRLDPIMAGAARNGTIRETGAPDFSKIYYQVHVYNQEGVQQDISFSAHLSRGFFKARNDWTCYRRNYITVSVRLDDLPQALLLYNGQTLVHFGFKLSGCTCRDPPEPIDLIQHTAKRDKGPQDQPEFRSIEGHDFQTLWDRIQFRTATANNGKKQEQQQYFSLRVSLMAYATGQNLPSAWVEIASRYSDPLVVRGRSPGHYNDHNDRTPSTNTSPAPSQVSPVVTQARPLRIRSQQAIAPRPANLAPHPSTTGASVQPALRRTPRIEPYPMVQSIHPGYPQGMRMAPEHYPRSTPEEYARPVESVAPALPAIPMQIQLPPLRLDGPSGMNDAAARLPTYDEVVQGSVSPGTSTERSLPSVAAISEPVRLDDSILPPAADLTLPSNSTLQQTEYVTVKEETRLMLPEPSRAEPRLEDVHSLVGLPPLQDVVAQTTRTETPTSVHMSESTEQALHILAQISSNAQAASI